MKGNDMTDENGIIHNPWKCISQELNDNSKYISIS